MKTQSYLKILNKGSISNELELEKALIVERKLRLLAKESPELADTRNKIRAIIKEYESLIKKFKKVTPLNLLLNKKENF